jgi:transcriptional regulator
MYRPPAFVEDDPEELHAIMRSCSLPVLVSPVREGAGFRMAATHMPLMLLGDRLVGHLARGNTQWQLLAPEPESLAIFSGIDGYVSPSFYATKRETGRVVPTWNYEAVHAYGRLEVIEDTTRILEVVSSLTDHHEGSRKNPWKVADAPEDYIARQLHGIVAVVLHVTRLLGVRKLSQNKTHADFDGVLAGQVEENPVLAEHMQRVKRD